MSSIAEAKQEVIRYVKARIPLIIVKSDEQLRSITMIREAVREIPGMHHVLCHTRSKGFYDIETKQVFDESGDYYAAVDYMREQMNNRSNNTFILTDVVGIEDGGINALDFNDIVQQAMESNSTIVIIYYDPIWELIRRSGLFITLSKPNEDEAYEIIHDFISDYRSQVTVEWTEEDEREAAQALAGVSEVEIENTIASLLAKGSITKKDLYDIRSQKDQLFQNMFGLEKIHLDANEGEIGGLEALKRWLADREPLLTPEKLRILRAHGLKAPRGVLLVGVPGCGKSLAAKAIAFQWKLPLYRLDFATVQGMYVGQSEIQLRAAFNKAEDVAPCVLWIDEIEKGLAGAGTDSTGVPQRMVGQFLFWLQECKKVVFVVATANDITKLPPELLRKGRFDEIFFVDLPNEEERREIIALYMKKYLGITPFTGDFADELVDMTENFSGSDLEAIIRGLSYQLIKDPSFMLTDVVMRKAFSSDGTLFKTSPEQIESIRTWGRTHAISASDRPIGESTDIHRDGTRTRQVII